MNPPFYALLEEAKFTREIPGSGVTQIDRANYAQKGIYFQAFSSLSIGLERIGKLCVIDADFEGNKKGKNRKFCNSSLPSGLGRNRTCIKSLGNFYSIH